MGGVGEKWVGGGGRGVGLRVDHSRLDTMDGAYLLMRRFPIRRFTDIMAEALIGYCETNE